MKRLIVAILCYFLLSVSHGQPSNIKTMVNSLRFMKADTLDCNADLYWKIIAQGNKAIPFLIDKLNDTSETNISFHCKRTKLNLAELAFLALDEIAFFPTFEITHLQFDVIHNDCWSFYDYFYNNKNKSDYKRMVKAWYSNNKTKLKSTVIPKKQLTDCQKKYKIYIYYNLEE